MNHRCCCCALPRRRRQARRLRPWLNSFGGAVSGGDAKVVVVLEVEPELGRQAEIPSETEGGVSTDGALSAHDLVDAREAQRLGERIALTPIGP